MTEHPYIPATRIKPARVLERDGCPSSWAGIESILADLLGKFSVCRGWALEFGCEFGYSAIALSNFFEHVMTVDLFGQLAYDGRPMRVVARENLKPYDNINLLEESSHEFIASVSGFPMMAPWDLIHIDANHTYEDVMREGKWAIDHAPVVIFHDTESFECVKQAVWDLAEQNNKQFHNFTECHGLGILV
jgi:hypothetical protein